jgi:hypothetical protein
MRTAILGVLSALLLGSSYVVGGILAAPSNSSAVATSETLVIEATEGTSSVALEVPSGACPNPNSGFVPQAAVSDFVTPGGWIEDLAIYDRNGNGLVCVKDHPARGGPKQGDVIVIDSSMDD